MGTVVLCAASFKYKVLHAITRVYLWVIRGTPVIVQAFMIYFGIRNCLVTNACRVASIITLTLNAGALFV
ncbi:MAG: ABC transporter permease subunit [Eubacteriales bacterium]